MRQLAIAFLCIVAAPLAADTLTVTVSCNNGQKVGNLPITVYDFVGTLVPDATQTNAQGVFVIDNSETYTSPFSLFFKSAQGSTCGAYRVVSLMSNIGYVQLNYYPVELPCSCSKLTH